MAAVTSEPNLIFVEDVAYGAAVSEAMLTKIGGTHNYILNYFKEYPFGITGGYYSNLTVPYATLSTEIVNHDAVITDLFFEQELSGSSGTTEIYILKNGSTIFSVNPAISFSAGSNVSFYGLTGPTPSGVIKPVLLTTTLTKGDVLQMVLYTAAFQGRNFQCKIIARPV
jgi:hypothetical protein